MTLLRAIAITLAQIFLFQTFYYVKEFPPGYLMEKILLPVAGMALASIVFLVHQKNNRRLANAGWLTILFASYFMFTGCLTAYLFYSQSPQLTISSQAKILPFFYFFVAYYVATTIKPTARMQFFSLLFTGTLLAIAFIIAAKTVNVAAYYTPGSTVFKLDAKGYRLIFPATLIITAYFACVHYARYRRSLIVYAAGAIMAYFIIFDLKQRVELLAVMLATLSALAGRKWAGLINICFGLVCAGVVIAAVFQSQLTPYMRAFSDDTSWIARKRQLDYVFSLWYEVPLSIPLGVGKMSEVGDYGYKELIGFKFTTADLGWIGMAHEYGVIGTAVLVAMIVVLYRAVPHGYQLNNLHAAVVAGAFKSYILMTIFLSVIAPRFLYNSGVFFAMFAFSIYLRQKYGENQWLPAHEETYTREQEELQEHHV